LSQYPPPQNNDNDAPIQAPIINTLYSHYLGKYTLTVVTISYDGLYKRWVDIDNVTFLVTDYILYPPSAGPHEEPAESILADKNNESNLASGIVREIKNNTNSDVTFYDIDNNDMITIDDIFTIDVDIIPIDATEGIDFHLIYQGEYYTDTFIFRAMGRRNIGRYNERIQFSIEDKMGFDNINITYIDNDYFQRQTFSNFSIRVYNQITGSTVFWGNLIDLLNNESSDVIFYDNDNNSILSNLDNFLILNGSYENFSFQIFYESTGKRIGSAEKD
jgi:hypothetical protein